MQAPVETLKVHRCRFVDWTPSPITAIAFPPPSLHTESFNEPKIGLLAVGRANGNIELSEWTGSTNQAQAHQAWVLRKTLPGPTPSKVDSLALTLRDATAPQESSPSMSQLRLFSAGGGSELLEWNMEEGIVARSISSQGGAIWCIAANPACTLLALGCEDGSVHILTLENDKIGHFRRLDRVKARLLSIAWGPPTKTTPASAGDDSDMEDEVESLSDSWLVTGCSDSSIRRWDAKSGRMIERMGTDKTRGQSTLVWAVGVISDGTIVSGDSLGMVKFWDHQTGTQLQSFQPHGADVLCIAIGSDGQSLFASGVDQKISQFSRVEVNGESTSHARWIHACSRRLHSHDVRALAVWPPYVPIPGARRPPSSIAPILASGGLDMSVVVTPCAMPSMTSSKLVNPLGTSAVSTFEDSYHRRLAHCSDSIQVAQEAKIVVCRRDTSLTLWKIKDLPPETYEDGPAPSDQTGWTRVAELDLKTHTNLISSAISSNGKWLAVSDLKETRVFSLSYGGGDQVTPKRMKSFSTTLHAQLPMMESDSTGATSLLFSADSNKLVLGMAASAHVVVVDLQSSPLSATVLRSFSHHRIRDFVVHDGQNNRVIKSMPGEKANDMEIEEVLSSICGLAASADGQWLASTDLLGRTHIFNMDSMQHHCTLPTFERPVKFLAFDPSSPHTLLLAFPDNSLQIFDAEARNFPEWSRPLIESLPANIGDIHDVIQGISFIPAPAGRTSHAILWSGSWLCKIKLGEAWRLSGYTRKKRQRDPAPADLGEGKEVDQSLKLVTKYRPIMTLECIGAGELVIVERPLLDILGTLPPAYYKPKYGT